MTVDVSVEQQARQVNDYFDAALNLHKYVVASHWNAQGLVGPDPGIRFNYRIGRFVKSYFPSRSWNDDLYYLQAQGYWTAANWQLFSRTGNDAYRDIALSCSKYMLAQQRDDGAWDYPNPEWKGRIATVEGTWAAIGLLDSYRQSGDSTFLQGALRWHRFALDTIGFQRVNDQLAVNYFANKKDKGGRVPAASANVLRLFAELAHVTGRTDYLEPCKGLVNFLRTVQTSTGEFPYAVEGLDVRETRLHFQCYQYNAFQCLELIRYFEITDDTAVLPLIAAVLGFLSQGLGSDGHVLYQCCNRYRAVTYHAAAVGAAFARARQLGIDGYEDLSHRAFSYVLRMRQPDGGYIYSRRDYRLLSDRRSYPRYLAMILYHLLLRASAGKKSAGREAGPVQTVLEPREMVAGR
jgi:hypothetical protein